MKDCPCKIALIEMKTGSPANKVQRNSYSNGKHITFRSSLNSRQRCDNRPKAWSMKIVIDYKWNKESDRNVGLTRNLKQKVKVRHFLFQPIFWCSIPCNHLACNFSVPKKLEEWSSLQLLVSGCWCWFRMVSNAGGLEHLLLHAPKWYPIMAYQLKRIHLRSKHRWKWYCSFNNPLVSIIQVQWYLFRTLRNDRFTSNWRLKKATPKRNSKVNASNLPYLLVNE